MSNNILYLTYEEVKEIYVRTMEKVAEDFPVSLMREGLY